MSTPCTIETLLAQRDWMRGLARHLVADADADDFTQEAWRAALESPPDAGRPVRPWLAEVLRNTIRSAFRSAGRRRARELAGGTPDSVPPSAEDVLLRAQLHHRIALLLTELDEPYRATLVARFYEGLDSAEIGRRWGIPAGTVRSRLSEGVRRLRAALDQDHAGDRERWRSVLLAAARDSGSAPGMRGPAARPALGPGTVALVLTATAALGTGALLVRVLRNRPIEVAAGGDLTSPSAGAARNKEQDMTSTTSHKRAAALVGSALTVLAAGAEAHAAITEEAVSWCLELREKVFACKDEFAEAFVARKNAPAAQRMALWGKAIEEITEEGSGALGPRREKCRAWIERGRREEPEGDARARLQQVKNTLAACGARDCKARVECLMPTLHPGPAPTPPADEAPQRLGDGRVVGKVVEMETGAPVADAEVLVLEMSSQRNLAPVRTDAAGAFKVEGVRVGEALKLVAIGDRTKYVLERRLIQVPGNAVDAGVLRLVRGDMKGRVRDGTWRGVTGIKASEDETATVARVNPGSPAHKAGIRDGDRIVAIDGQDVRGLPHGGVEWRLRGKPGSSVTVTVQTGNAPPRSATLARILD